MLSNDFCFTDIYLFRTFLVLVLKCHIILFIHVIYKFSFHVFSLTGLQQLLVALGLPLVNFILILTMKK